MFSIGASGFLTICALAAANDGPTATRGDVPANRVIVRVSDAMLGSLMGKQDVDRQVDVRDVILGTSVYGQARIVGKPGVKLAESQDQATFYIILSGAAYSRTTGYNGPAIIYSRSVTTFTAAKQIVFEPGKGFHGLPPTVTARTQVFVEGIGSTRSGLIGNIVRRRAASIQAARHAEATEIARQKAERRIAAAFDRDSEQRLARLNWIADLRSTAAAALRTTGSGEPRYVLCTTPHYLQIATSFGDGGSVIDLPTTDAADAQDAAIEIWVHESLMGDGIAAAIELLGTQSNASDLLKTISASILLAQGRANLSSQLQPPLREQQIQVRKMGEWRVVGVEIPTDKSITVSTTSDHRAAANSSPASSLRQTAPSGLDQSPVSRPNRRIWTSGQFTADAEFLSLDGNMVRLQRSTGVRTSIPLEKLSVADQEWIRTHLSAR
jgi:hypothetical protein